MAEIRRRKVDAAAASSASDVKNGSSARQSQNSPGTLIYVCIVVLGVVSLMYFSGAGGFITGKPAADLPAASTSTVPLPSVSSQATGTAPGSLELTDTELRAYDGTDPDKPLYVAINGTIFDVSQGRSFYGPGTHYGHFAGRDATRAWVTECFGEEHLTHDMRGVEEMFMPHYLDEDLEDAANGEGAAAMAPELRNQAAKALKRFGQVGEKVRRERYEEDLPVARESVEKALAHWVQFFAGSGKYEKIGRVVRNADWEKSAPAPPPLCKEALKKRPMKGGKLDSLMGKQSNLAGSGGQGEGKKASKDGRSGEMPPHIKKMVEEKAKAKTAS